MTFNWLIPFVDSFVNSDWFELVIYFHTNEEEDELNVLRGFKASVHLQLSVFLRTVLRS